MHFLLLHIFFFSSKALHPTVVDRCSNRHFSLCPVISENSPREFRPFFPCIKIPSTVVDRCSDRHFSLCPVIGRNSPREFRLFFPRNKIPSWMHSELHFPTVNHPGAVIYRKCKTGNIIVTSQTDNTINI